MSRLRSAAQRVGASTASDAVLGAVLFATAEFETLAQGESTAFAVAVPFFTLTLAWRRRAPLAVAVVAAAALGAAAVAAPLEFSSAGALLAVAAVLYSAGAHLPRRAAALGLAAMLAAATIEEALQGGGDLIFAAVTFAAPWLIGRGIREQRRQESALADAVARLEQERERNARLAVAAERLRVARDLHDTVAGLLNVVVVQAAVAEQCARQDTQRAVDALAAVQESGRLASADLRRMLGVLRDSTDWVRVEPAPGLDRVDDLVALARSAGLSVELTTSGARRPLPAGLDVSAYRILQEALTNVVKHARGARADVEVRYTPDAVEVVVRDGGGERTPAVEPGGHGLVGMRERTALFGGELQAAPTADGGFAVRARLPLEGAPA
jgi:signal transduction histidine kinase